MTEDSVEYEWKNWTDQDSKLGHIHIHIATDQKQHSDSSTSDADCGSCSTFKLVEYKVDGDGTEPTAHTRFFQGLDPYRDEKFYVTLTRSI